MVLAHVARYLPMLAEALEAEEISACAGLFTGLDGKVESRWWADEVFPDSTEQVHFAS